MEKIIKINSAYHSLKTLCEALKTNGAYESSIAYDIWEVRTDSNGQMAQCVLLKKSGMHAVKLYLTVESDLKISYVIPNKLMNVYFGKHRRVRQNILELITTKIKEAILEGSQKKAFDELANNVRQAVA